MSQVEVFIRVPPAVHATPLPPPQGCADFLPICVLSPVSICSSRFVSTTTTTPSFVLVLALVLRRFLFQFTPCP